MSLHPRKIITTAEGGLVVTREAELADRVGWLRNHGMLRTPRGIVFQEIGIAARMSEVHAAIGIAQMERLDGIIEGRARSALQYRERLVDADGIVPTPATWHPGRVYQSLVLRLRDGIDRDHVVASLRAQGIESTLGTYAIHRQPAFAARCRLSVGGLAGSVTSTDQSITLPLWPDMAEADVDRVTDALQELIQ